MLNEAFMRDMEEYEDGKGKYKKEKSCKVNGCICSGIGIADFLL